MFFQHQDGVVKRVSSRGVVASPLLFLTSFYLSDKIDLVN
jgi:hypothetical protein